MSSKRFPAPPQDRRQQHKENPSKSRISHLMPEMIQRQIQQLRDSIQEFQIIPNRTNPNLDYNTLPNSINIILFGPSGSGKSSLIRSLYRAYQRSQAIPNEFSHKIVVKGSTHNEGTTLFSTVVIKEESNYGNITSGIKVHDTRGQIWMDANETEQVDLVMSGKVKDMSKVEQRTHRYAFKLWEFWKSDSQLFPMEIIKKNPGIGDRPHCLLFVFDGSMDEIPNGPEETMFYREIIQRARGKGFFYPQIILTHIDAVECQLAGGSDEDEARLRELIDLKIESVVMNLGIPRSSVHFVENYHEGQHDADISIDFNILRLLHECVQQADAYLQSQVKERSRCVIQ